MTKLLEEAIGQAQKLPAAEQDRVAELILGFAGNHSRLQLTKDQLAQVERARVAARSGAFASDAEMAELWKQFGL